MNPFLILSNFNAIKDNAMQFITEFLDKLLRENADKINREAGENELLFIMHPVGRAPGSDKKEYIISLVAIDENNTICRVISSITLSNIASEIQNALKNA